MDGLAPGNPSQRMGLEWGTAACHCFTASVSRNTSRPTNSRSGCRIQTTHVVYDRQGGMKSVVGRFNIRDLTPEYVVLELSEHRGAGLGRLEMHLAVVDEPAGSVCWWMNYAGDFVIKQHVGRA